MSNLKIMKNIANIARLCFAALCLLASAVAQAQSLSLIHI